MARSLLRLAPPLAGMVYAPRRRPLARLLRVSDALREATSGALARLPVLGRRSVTRGSRRDRSVEGGSEGRGGGRAVGTDALSLRRGRCRLSCREKQLLLEVLEALDELAVGGLRSKGKASSEVRGREGAR